MVQILISMGLKLLTEKALTELLLFGVREMAKSSKTLVDDKLVAIIDKHLKG